MDEVKLEKKERAKFEIEQPNPDKIGQIIQGYYGEVDGYYLYRFNASKQDLTRIIVELTNLGLDFRPPEMEIVRNGQWTMLLFIKTKIHK